MRQSEGILFLVILGPAALTFLRETTVFAAQCLSLLK